MFASELKTQRERLGLTQAEAAALVCDMPRRTWQDMERGEREPPGWVQALILRALKAARPRPASAV